MQAWDFVQPLYQSDDSLSGICIFICESLIKKKTGKNATVWKTHTQWQYLFLNSFGIFFHSVPKHPNISYHSLFINSNHKHAIVSVFSTRNTQWLTTTTTTRNVYFDIINIACQFYLPTNRTKTHELNFNCTNIVWMICWLLVLRNRKTSPIPISHATGACFIMSLVAYSIMIIPNHTKYPAEDTPYCETHMKSTSSHNFITIFGIFQTKEGKEKGQFPLTKSRRIRNIILVCRMEYIAVHVIKRPAPARNKRMTIWRPCSSFLKQFRNRKTYSCVFYILYCPSSSIVRTDNKNYFRILPNIKIKKMFILFVFFFALPFRWNWAVLDMWVIAKPVHFIKSIIISAEPHTWFSLLFFFVMAVCFHGQTNQPKKIRSKTKKQMFVYTYYICRRFRHEFQQQQQQKKRNLAGTSSMFTDGGIAGGRKKWRYIVCIDHTRCVWFLCLAHVWSLVSDDKYARIIWVLCVSIAEFEDAISHLI